VSTFAKASASLDRLREIFDPAYRVEDNPDGKELPDSSLSVALLGVEFRYTDDAPVARDVSFFIPANETVCIVGSTGAGKSTLLSLLLRLYEPTDGTIHVGGLPLNEIRLSSLRERIALVPQEPWMLDTTIGENISFGQSGVTRGEVRHVARLALVDEFADRLPEGYDTMVGEAGVLLSGGQRRRIALARALLRDSSILLLDEPTSGLDAKSEETVLKAIDAVGTNHTVVIVSHRLRVAENADRVIVLEEGRVTEHGTHHELLKAGGRYHELWIAQNREQRTNGRNGLDSVADIAPGVERAEGH
jgi:ABC-type multidrug transport system fused ATPase/permease subunit